MKRYIVITVVLVVVLVGRAGPVGWLTSKTLDWKFIQDTGGMVIEAPAMVDGRLMLPVQYDISGTRKITRQPVLINSALAVSRVKLTRRGGILVLTVVASAEKREGASGRHLVPLEGMPNGRYQVFYGRSNDPEARLGEIEVGMPGP